jgi:glycosyltransferase involved in cell wall biosynthesis
VSTTRLTIVRHGAASPVPADGETIITTDELKNWIRSGRVLARAGRYGEVRLFTDRVDALGRPLPAALAARLLSRGACYVADGRGRRRPLPAGLLMRWLGQAIAEPFTRGSLIAGVTREVAALEAAARSPQAGTVFHPEASPLYLRADLSFGVKAGGSVGHTAGVINHLGDFAGPPIVITSDPVPTVAPTIETHTIEPDEAFWHYQELPAFVMNQALLRTAAGAVGTRVPAFIYQRYTLNGYAAVQLARQWQVPLITEYNGSEVWVARHWGRPLVHESLSTRIEHLNLTAAHLVSVVSRPLADEVIAIGVAPSRVLVNPNGVEPERYRPDIDATAVRNRLGLMGRTVIGFIGTFGPWHGAEVLARAFVQMLSAQPDLRDRVRLLWIGDGATMPAVRAILREGGADEACVFAGLVPQADGPSYLAACDIYASPHVPNQDGSPFFGSPTKLFEYMAMGRGIVASSLDQIAEVLQDGSTALLVPPGDAGALATAVRRLVDDRPLRLALGEAARREVLARHTWHAHVGRTVAALRQAS